MVHVPGTTLENADTWNTILKAMIDVRDSGKTKNSNNEKKSLNIGLVGYGFMGRTTQTGTSASVTFPDLGHPCSRPSADVPKATKAFAEQWGFGSRPTGAS